MKTGRRQELRANELSQLLTDAGTFLRKNSSYVVVGLIVIGGVFGSRWYVNDRSAVALSAAYGQLLSLGLATNLTTDDECRESIERLKELASEVQQDEFTLEALSSRALIASSRLVNSTSGEVQLDFVEELRQACAEIIDRYSDHALEYGTALMGQATVEQTLFVADEDPVHRDRAEQFLRQIVGDARLELTPLAPLASERVNALDDIFQPITLATRPPPQVSLPTTTTSTEPDNIDEATPDDTTAEEEVASPEPVDESPTTTPEDSAADETATDDASPDDAPPGEEDASAASPTEPE